tara:strand:- start:218 stop:337 length:120 start_codon:yes stop_codon:yes gene_type:complete
VADAEVDGAVVDVDFVGFSLGWIEEGGGDGKGDARVRVR